MATCGTFPSLADLSRTSDTVEGSDLAILFSVLTCVVVAGALLYPCG